MKKIHMIKMTTTYKLDSWSKATHVSLFKVKNLCKSEIKINITKKKS